MNHLTYKFLSFLFLFTYTQVFATYYSQEKQDEFVNEHFFHNKTKGVFVEIGAHNGVMYSNTLFFEEQLGWNGICVEPIPERFLQLKNNRSCICVQGCVSDQDGPSQLLLVSSSFVNTEMLSGLMHKYDPRHLQRVDREIAQSGGTRRLIDVNCYRLNTLLEQHNIQHIDFLSIDTEGGELDILSSIDFSKIQIDVICVEDNYSDPTFNSFLTKKGYYFVKRLGADLIFAHKTILTKS